MTLADCFFIVALLTAATMSEPLHNAVRRWKIRRNVRELKRREGVHA
jgi:hypothetical protein